MTRKGWLAGLAVAALASIVVAVRPAQADGCRRSYGAAYVAPTYQAPANYGYGYQYEVLVPYAQKVVVNPDFYFGVGDEYRQLAFAKLVARELAELRGPPPAPPAVKPEVPAPIPPAKKDGGPEAKLGPADLARPVATGLPEGFRELVGAKCQACHSAGKKGQAKLDLADLDRLGSLSVAERMVMYHAVSSGAMPKDGEVDQGALDAFGAYAGLGYKALVASAKN